MSDSPSPVRPVPRWLHAWAVLAAAWALAVLALGALVTTFHVGMSDPVWPTQPWYLLVNGWQEPRPGFLIEHTHRIAAFGIGVVSALLALGIWFSHLARFARWVGSIGVVVLVGAFMHFHYAMMAQRDAVHIEVPVPTVAAMGAAFALLLLLGAGECLARTPGAGLRLLVVLTLVAVMVQGLLGGFRVRLHELLGPDLALIHGVFAQIVFGLTVSLAVLTAPARPAGAVAPETRLRLNRFALLLVAVVFLQLLWGAMVRHAPTPLVQRLHLITAFAVVAAAVWLLRTAFATAAGRAELGAGGWGLAALLVAQVVLGVEAWMGKFGQYQLPELVAVTEEVAVVRTLHALVGAGVLATAVALAVRTGARVPVAAAAGSPAPAGVAWSARPARAEAVVGGPQLGETA